MVSVKGIYIPNANFNLNMVALRNFLIGTNTPNTLDEWPQHNTKGINPLSCFSPFISMTTGTPPATDATNFNPSPSNFQSGEIPHLSQKFDALTVHVHSRDRCCIQYPIVNWGLSPVGRPQRRNPREITYGSRHSHFVRLFCSIFRADVESRQARERCDGLCEDSLEYPLYARVAPFSEKEKRCF